MHVNSRATERSVTRFYSADVRSGNQYAEMAESLAPVVQFVRQSLRLGKPVSEIALDLHRQGHIGFLVFVFVFSEATNARLEELKRFGAWWIDDLPSNHVEIDLYANQIHLHNRISHE